MGGETRGAAFFTVQASSSNPRESVDNEDIVTSGDAVRDMGGESPRFVSSDAAVASEDKSIGSVDCLVVGGGRPLRVVFKPPLALVNNPGGAGVGSPILLAMDDSIESCASLSDLLGVGGGAYFFSMYFVTRMMSPSLKPKLLIVPGSKSSNKSSSIRSRSKLFAYRVQSSISHPAPRKKSNQSVGFLVGG